MEQVRLLASGLGGGRPTGRGLGSSGEVLTRGTWPGLRESKCQPGGRVRTRGRGQGREKQCALPEVSRRQVATTDLKLKEQGWRLQTRIREPRGRCSESRARDREGRLLNFAVRMPCRIPSSRLEACCTRFRAWENKQTNKQTKV